MKAKRFLATLLLATSPVWGVPMEASPDAGQTSAPVASATTATPSGKLEETMALMDQMTDGELATVEYLAKTKVLARQTARNNAKVEQANTKVLASVDTLDATLEALRDALEKGSTSAVQAPAPTPAASLLAPESVKVVKEEAPAKPVATSAKAEKKVAKRVRGKEKPRHSRNQKARMPVAKAPALKPAIPPKADTATQSRPTPATTSAPRPQQTRVTTTIPCSPFMTSHQWEETCGKTSVSSAVVKAPAVAPETSRPAPVAKQAPAPQKAVVPAKAMTKAQALAALAKEAGISPQEIKKVASGELREDGTRVVIVNGKPLPRVAKPDTWASIVTALKSS